MIHDLVIIGAGPGGYTAAIRAAQLGMDVAVVEKETVLGGTCLRVGCIPSKALLEATERYRAARHESEEHGLRFTGLSFNVAAMQARKAKVVGELGQGVTGLLKKHKVKVYPGAGTVQGRGSVTVRGAGDAEPLELAAKHILIATGSRPAPLKGVALDGRIVGGSTEALQYDAPPKRLAVIGAGAIGLELGSVWQRLGSQVTVLEYLDRILPEMDEEIARAAQRLFERQGLVFKLGCRVSAARADGEEGVVEIAGQEPVRADRVLLAVGRVPNTDGLGLEQAGVKLDGRGRIEIDQHWRTSVPDIYAIGDVVPGAMLAHKAEDEGVACVEALATGVGHVNYLTIPAVVYTAPEVAAVGRTEQQLTELGVPFRKGVFQFRANGRARIQGHLDGFVKLLAHAETDRILGVHILGAHAGDLIAEAAAAMEFGASAEDLARTCHAHPTMPEALREAALAALGRPLHS